MIKVYKKSSKGDVDFTGGVKEYPFGHELTSGSKVAGFTLTVYGRFEIDDELVIQLSSSQTGNIKLLDTIIGLKDISI